MLLLSLLPFRADSVGLVDVVGLVGLVGVGVVGRLHNLLNILLWCMRIKLSSTAVFTPRRAVLAMPFSGAVAWYASGTSGW